jgi:hypothetical protein
MVQHAQQQEVAAGLMQLTVTQMQEATSQEQTVPVVEDACGPIS